ncbi:MAG: DUF4178 domain-containing protein [Myxococcota bacterium]|nr:DUF4178 domain-containing protein [Myxococcota bacterium]
MSARIIDCPNCGGQVEFKAGSSLLSVCSYCSSAVARVGDDIGEAEILGQVAPLAEIGSPLSLGVQGQLHSKDFTVVGRLQLNYGAGPWNEWYLAFDDGRWAWLAEAQGRVYVTFEKDLEDLHLENPSLSQNGSLPLFEDWSAGQKFFFGQQTVAVSERRSAKFVSAEGELPFVVPLDSTFSYCDFEGPKGTFGTLDFGDSQEVESVYFGREHEYDSLFDKDVLDSVEASLAAAAVAMNCPNCGAAVQLQAPGESETVTCGTCDALLDCSKGQELFLLSSAAAANSNPLIPLGTVGNYQDKEWTVFGHLIRSVWAYGVRYEWEEYLLRAGRGSYRWLICSDGHWTWSEPVSVADVTTKYKRSNQERPRWVKHKGQSYRHFQSGSATVEALSGEFYWKVKVGDSVKTHDYVAPPNMMSFESSEDQDAQEISWSRGTYLSREEMSAIFSDKLSFPKAPFFNIAPHQPNKYLPLRDKVTKVGLILSALIILIAILVSSVKPSGVIFDATKELRYYEKSDKEAATLATVLTEPFEIKEWTNLRIALVSDVANNWIFLQGALINEDKNEVQYFGLQNQYYFGPGWTEGSRKKSTYIGSVAPGKYRLSLRPEMGKPKPKKRRRSSEEIRYSVELKQGTFIKSHVVVFLFFIWIFPLFVRGLFNRFERKRWSESDYG